MISKYSVKKPFTVLVGVILVIVLGVVSLFVVSLSVVDGFSLGTEGLSPLQEASAKRDINDKISFFVFMSFTSWFNLV